jgi:hypothetical protein
MTAAGLALGATAAHAAPVERFGVSTGFDRTVPVRTAGDGAHYRPLSVTFHDISENTLRGVKIAVDGSALHGFAELNLPKGCAYTSADHLRESCALGDARYGTGEFSVGVRALPAAAAGRTGRVAFTVTAANGAAEADPQEPRPTVGVTVGDGADLAVSDLGRSYKVTPGHTTALPLRLTNEGSRDGRNIVVFLHDQYSRSTVLGNYSNCLYERYDGARRGAYCTFPDTVIKPGETLELSDPFTLATPAGAHSDEIQYGAGLPSETWLTAPADGTRGTGGVLRLVPAPTAKSGTYSSGPTVDIDEYNNLYYTRLDTGTTTDVAGVNGSVSAVIGKDTPVTFTVRNTGSTTISGYDKDFKGTVGVYAAFPASVRVTKTPQGCRLLHGGPEGLSAYPLGKTPVIYACVRTTTLAPGRTAGFTFHIVALKAVPGQYAGLRAEAVEDPTADYLNNSAHMVINATTASASTPAPSSSVPPATNAPSADGNQSGPQLASTGSGPSTMWMVLGGTVVLGAGAATLAAVRRRSSSGRA